jgi:hypothetical protein
MLIGHLAWYADACHRAPFEDVRTRANVLAMLPALAQERRELLQMLAQHRRLLSAEDRRMLAGDAAECRRAIHAARRRAAGLNIHTC